MRFRGTLLLCAWGVLCLPLAGRATTRYVSPSGSHTAPFTNWVAAATNIQAAIDASTAGDVVWVTNGFYQTGGRVASGSATTNRVVIDKAIALQSVNGPAVTVIRGAYQPGTTNGLAAVRCVWMTNGATLAGFTLTNGATRISDSGGGAWCSSTACYLSNCVVSGNAADSDGGGVLYGTLSSCTLAGNAAGFGGGASLSVLTSCLVSNNRAATAAGVGLGTLSGCVLTGNRGANFGGGVSGGTLTNCILRENVSTNQGGGAYAATLYDCVLETNTAVFGGGAALSTLSGCTVISNVAINAGGGAYTSVLHRCNVSFNITENFGGGASKSTLNNCLLYANFAGSQAGGAVDSTLNNCTVLRNGALLNAGGVQNAKVVNSIVYFNQSGLVPYEHDLSTFTNSCTTPLPPGAGNTDEDPQFVQWSTGHARLLPTSPCLNAGSNGLAVGALDLDGNVRTNLAVVDMGAYELGYHYVARSNATPVAPYLTWGTAATSIQDAVDAACVGSAILVSNGVYDTGGRAVPGRQLTNRVYLHKPVLVQSVNGPLGSSIQGQGPRGTNAVRGVWMTNQSALIGFTIANGSTGPDAYPVDDWIGGGVHAVSEEALISRCILRGNSARVAGGVYRGTLNSCLVVGNASEYEGGGAVDVRMDHCTVSDNTAGSGGGVFISTVRNSIVHFNQAASGPNFSLGTYESTCSSPVPPGTNNMDADPLFRNRAGGDYRLKYSSPCLDPAGAAAVAGPRDLDGNPRLAGSAQDMGAYELHVFYAFAGNTFAAYPYTTFFTGASTLQAAVDAAYTGAVVYAVNGSYDQGGRPAAGSLLTNRVVVEKPLEIVGLSFPTPPVIQGAGPVGDAAVRCAWLGEEVYLRNFILSGGATRASGDPGTEQSGGGVWAQSASAEIEGCWLSNNQAASDGGGASGGRLESCLLTRNSAGFGGGASFYFCPGGLFNCTVISNLAGQAGGVYGGANANCIVRSNSAPTQPNYDAAAFTYSCVSPNAAGAGNFDADPLFRNAATGDYRLAYSSPCVDSGDSAQVRATTALGGGVRLAGSTVDLGAYEVLFAYADVHNPTPSPPYASWQTAATNIQDAVDYMPDGGIVLVSNGVYQSGGHAHPLATLTNRVLVQNAVLLKSVNGPVFTTIRGQGPNGDDAVRGVWLGNGATLAGFTISNVATRTSGVVADDQCGGGVASPSSGGTVTHCVIAGNTAEAEGGGASGGILFNCLIKENHALYGGGASFTYAPGVMDNCTVVGNSSFGAVGGVKGGVELNCIVYGNFGTGNPNFDSAVFAYSCTTPDPAGDHCITNNPKFENAAAGDYHLHFTSPCIEAGYNFEAADTTDLAGNLRILDNVVEMGAFEYTGNVVDSDGDGYVDHEEQIAGTSPTNSASLFRVNSVLLASGVPQFTFNSVSGRVYTIETRDNLLTAPDWTPSVVYTSAVDAELFGLSGLATTRFSRLRVRMAP